MDEVLMGRVEFSALQNEEKYNLANLLASVNFIRGMYGKPMRITSGYRTKDINALVKGSTRSAHLVCMAVDIHDPTGEFAQWCLDNIPVLEKAGLFMENPEVTRGWVHLQTRRPLSGTRVFNP